LEDAQAAGDAIRSVIVNSGVNQDGRTRGIAMPNGEAQEALIRQVYKEARVDPSRVGYVEAHGTGTKVGDPLEATALQAVFGEGRTARQPLFIGSVKSNIGHLEGTSGIVAVIKTALMLERGFVLPNCNFEKANEEIPLDKWNMKVKYLIGMKMAQSLKPIRSLRNWCPGLVVKPMLA
jgi:acyl transferase domain-containing protein